jgi:hypothetical protein
MKMRVILKILKMIDLVILFSSNFFIKYNVCNVNTYLKFNLSLNGYFHILCLFHHII